MNEKVDLSKYDNSWFNPGGNFLIRVLWYFVNVIFFINPLNPSSSIKVRLLSLFGAVIGENVIIKPSVNIKYPWKLKIGDNVWIGEKVWIDNIAKVELGNNVCLSQDSMLLTGNHNYKAPFFDLIVGEIKIEDGVWVGAKSIICPGVTIYTHAVLSVGSIATKNIEPYTINKMGSLQIVRDRIIN